MLFDENNQCLFSGSSIDAKSQGGGRPKSEMPALFFLFKKNAAEKKLLHMLSLVMPMVQSGFWRLPQHHQQAGTNTFWEVMLIV